MFCFSVRASSSCNPVFFFSKLFLLFFFFFFFLSIFYVLATAVTVIVVLLCSAHSGRRLVVLSSPFGHSGLCPAIPAASAVFRPFRPFRPLSGHSGSGHCSAAPAVFRPSPLPSSLSVWPSSSIRLSPSAGRASPVVWPLSVVRPLSGRRLFLAVGRSGYRFFLAAAVWLPPLQPLFSHSDRWMLGHSGYSATVRPPPLLGCRRNRFPRFSVALSSLSVSLLFGVGVPIRTVVSPLFSSMSVARYVPLCMSGRWSGCFHLCSSGHSGRFSLSRAI